MHNNKRRNNMNGGGGNGPHRHHNNRPRRFGGGGNGGRPQGGPDDPANVTRTRRNATQNREKYQMMARDALSAGDRVLAEYYLQHADHYHRVLLALPPEEVRQQPHFQQRQPNQNGEQGAGEPSTEGAQQGLESHQGHQEHQPMPPSAHGLPSFITQSVNAPDAGD